MSKEYTAGRRASYLNPIKMYVFISAFFFLCLISFINPILNRTGELNEIVQEGTSKKSNETVINYVDTSAENKLKKDIKVDSIHKQGKSFSSDSILKGDKKINKGLDIHYSYGQNYTSIKEYDSLQRLLSKDKQDGWVNRKRTEKLIRLKNEYGNDIGKLAHDLGEKFLHYFPQMFFISLPLFSFVLLLLYKKRKDIYFVNHAIFSFHLYCALFILMFVLIGLNMLEKVAYLNWLKYVQWIQILYIIWYLYQSLKIFYGQKFFKTVLKLIFLLMIQTFVLLMLFVLFLAISVLSI